MWTRLRSWCLVALAWVVFAQSTQPLEASAEEGPAKYAVIVNANNKMKFRSDDEARQTVRKLFLRTASQWSKDLKAKPFTPKDDDPAHAAFLARVLRMSKAEFARHWITMKNTEGLAPPKRVGSEKLMVKYVSRFPGGVGIVPIECQGRPSIRVLFTF